VNRDDISVCAVVGDAGVVDGQRRPPEHVVLLGDDGIREAVASAVATGASWLWLLDGSVAPAPDTLARLLAPLEQAAALGDPILLSSMVVTPGGELDTAAPPWPRLFWRENAILGAEHRLAALRAAHWGSLLVHSRALDLYGPPLAKFAGAGDDLEWTGRMLRETPGYIVPESIAVRERPVGISAAADARSRVRILCGDGWHGTDRLWFAFALLRDVSAQAVARPAAAARRARTASAGLLHGQ
jgi:hypothetical protein